MLAVFGFGALNFVVSEPAVATVGDARITQSEYAAELDRQRQQLANNFGDSFDPALGSNQRFRARTGVPH